MHRIAAVSRFFDASAPLFNIQICTSKRMQQTLLAYMSTISVHQKWFLILIFFFLEKANSFSKLLSQIACDLG